MSKLSYDGLKTFKEKNDETYMEKQDVLSVLDLEEETSISSDDIIIKAHGDTGDLVRMKATDFASKINSLNITSYSNKENVDIDMIYPVGSVYFSVNDSPPDAFIGGTWERMNLSVQLLSDEEIIGWKRVS